MPKENGRLGQSHFGVKMSHQGKFVVPKPERHPSGVTMVSRESPYQWIRLRRVNKFCQDISGSSRNGKHNHRHTFGRARSISTCALQKLKERQAVKRDGYGIYKVEFDVSGVTLCNPIFC